MFSLYVWEPEHSNDFEVMHKFKHSWCQIVCMQGMPIGCRIKTKLHSLFGLGEHSHI
jgi:dolichyl-phosphate-mannose--protein O-mannosyl transferase